MHQLYRGGSTITGRLQNKQELTFKASLSGKERLVLLFFLILILAVGGGLVSYIFSTVILARFNPVLVLAMLLVLVVEAIRLLQSFTLLVFAYFAKDPIPMAPQKNLKIAVMTTIVPGKEPFELVANTLMEMKRIKSAGNKVDVWLLDEGNDPYIKAQCKKMGIRHFSRKGVRKWNTRSGPFKARTKHGNHNAWRSKYENRYHIVAQMDPDHVPRPNFLTRTLGYFADPDVGFVVAPQVYGNLKESWIAKAAAFQAYVFHGIIQRGGNGLGAPLLIGTNHLYRTKAFKQIKGYQDSIIEDHLTSMVIYGAKNDKTGNFWKGVYTPDIVAVGEGPTSYTDYFNQQKRWAYGIWEIARKSTPGAVKQMTKAQMLTFLMLQFFYPSVAIAWTLSSVTALLFSLTANAYIGSASIITLLWLGSVASSLALFFWLRRFNLVEHERKDWGLEGMTLLLMCIPVYVSAGWQAITGKRLTYAVTAKGDLTSADNLRTFTPHLNWLMFNSFGLAAIFAMTHTVLSSSFGWTLEHMAICASPITAYAVSAYKSTPIMPLLKSALRIRKPAVLQLNFTGK